MPAAMQHATGLWEILRSQKKFWLTPLVVLLLLFGGLILVSRSSSVAPFIYMIF
jgi:hypothetical protein